MDPLCMPRLLARYRLLHGYQIRVLTEAPELEEIVRCSKLRV
jgi:hypothetical protein